MYRIILVLISTIFLNNASETASELPKLLQQCYTNDYHLNAPQTITTLVELLQKLEFSSTLNVRLLSTSILHSVIFDGIEKFDNVAGTTLPYRATGDSFFKYKLLVDYLTSGESSLFPNDALTPPELCFLHMLLSNTIDLNYRGDESTTCKHRSIELEEYKEKSICPIKRGILQTKWGSISGGHLIKAIASSLERTKASLKAIASTMGRLETSENIVDNVWVGTLAGDLAHALLVQAVREPDIGVAGFWNDTQLPRVYYLEEGAWDLSEAEILGGIDGLIMAKSLISYKDVRLSQLIDMYYSDRGILGVTARLEAFQKILNEVNLKEQFVNAVSLLQGIGTYDAFLYKSEIELMSDGFVKKFQSVAERIMKKYDRIESIHEVAMKSALETLIIVAGSYDRYTIEEIILGIFESTQVSYYNSKIGVINGQSGNWLANITREQFQLFHDLEQSTEEWPSIMSLHKSLETVIYHYQNDTCLSQPTGRSIIILALETDLTDDDWKQSNECFETIKESKPETSFLLVTSKQKRLFDLKANDHVIEAFPTASTLIHELSKYLAQIPGSFVNLFCQESQLQDYVVPENDRWYEIREDYLMVGAISTKFSIIDQGNISICGYTKTNEICKGITVNDEISFNSEKLCAPEVACTIEFRVSVNSTEVHCSDNTCRYPDQVRLNIIWQRSSGYVPAVLYVLLFINVLIVLIK